ncbi:uncharacterized protein [Argopecten irradians]|uniref:uncharacterized protein n=1 Tax=Argopecten irradians TaxID=31199 RepID=UPI0037144DD1
MATIEAVTHGVSATEDKWRLTYAEVVWAMPTKPESTAMTMKKELMKVSSPRRSRKMPKIQTKELMKLKVSPSAPRQSRFGTTHKIPTKKRFNMPMVAYQEKTRRKSLMIQPKSSLKNDEHVYQRVCIEITEDLTIILKAKSIRSIFRRNGVKQGQPNKKCVRSSFTRKRKEVINLPTGVHCCGIYHNNDFKYLDHFKKHHLETATDKQDISLPITRTTLRRGVQSEDSDKCTGSKGEETVGFLHQNPTFVFTHSDSKRLLCCEDVESNPEFDSKR